MVRSALRSSLRASAGDSATISHVGTAEELLRACNQGSQVVALCALDIDGVPLLAVMSQLLSASARVVIVGSQESASLVPELLLRGAAGFLPLETTDPRQLWEAVEAAASGGATLHPAVAMLVLEQWRATRSDEAPQLTAKEMEVLRAMMAGTPAKSIARDLGLSVKTIDTHRSKIFSKLGVRTGAQAVQRALELGLS
ncbi:two-component system, NarL family, nitrate/nitrite response regulator NarL [Blastococcus aurantiacus]|uniref:Two-component system, NarL family, nitrate/nitrite response regulator NarL n=1 Tax=Blastococcus aurantiacus TaxID=1550231 RepID=A0A1G7MTB7_9ACTN|nr:two-component system, NarL family, nitrate/nitrite response regulator NarL [Blastococcus aurantiacus]